MKVDIGGGDHISATLNSGAADELGLMEGKDVTAVFKATEVMLGVE